MSHINDTQSLVKPARRPPFKKSEAGFGMIELLVSLLILAIGLLGLASLQTTGLAQTAEVRNRSQAILLADDLLERIRSNRESLDSYAVAKGNLPACNSAFEIANNSVATDDTNEWKNSLACLLPNGNGSVVGVNGVVTIEVVWADNSAAGNGGSLTLDARP